MIEDDGLRARCGAAARAEVEKRLRDTVIAEQSVDVYRAWLAGAPAATSAPAARAAEPRGAEAEVAALRARVAALGGELAAARREPPLTFGRALKHVLTLGRSGR
jgi:hypothetical protein